MINKHHYFTISWLFITFSAVWTGSLIADVSLPAILSNNMVLQRDKELKIWGWADKNENVTVELNGVIAQGSADENGKWLVKFPPMKAGGPYEMVVTGKNKIAIHNIMVGEVWVCSGQSNMHWPVKFSANPDKEIKNARHPMLRLFYVRNNGRGDPQEDVYGFWNESSPGVADDFSAPGYFFGRDMMEKMNIPVGIIQSSWGGTSIEQWLSLEKLKSSPEFEYTMKGWEQILTEKPKAVNDRYDLMSAWFVYAFECMGQKTSYNPIPGPPPGYDRGFGAPSWLYNGMIAPLTNYAISGAAWCQGEGNLGTAYKYRALLPALIRDWRAQWDQGDFPFIIIEMSNTQSQETEPKGSTWAELREAQLMALDIPNTGLVVTIDLSLPNDDVHYKNKQEVGRRIALCAMKLENGHTFACSGPLYKSSRIENGKAIISFRNPQDGLMTKEALPLKGFAIAGADSVFVWADAVIHDNEVIVSSEKVKNPVAVRYAWADNPKCNLCDKTGLPAAPFRTDQWPGLTYGK